MRVWECKTTQQIEICRFTWLIMFLNSHIFVLLLESRLIFLHSPLCYYCIESEWVAKNLFLAFSLSLLWRTFFQLAAVGFCDFWCCAAVFSVQCAQQFTECTTQSAFLLQMFRSQLFFDLQRNFQQDININKFCDIQFYLVCISYISYYIWFTLTNWKKLSCRLRISRPDFIAGLEN